MDAIPPVSAIPPISASRVELLERIRKAVDAEPLGRTAAVAIMERLEREPELILEPLLEAGQEL